MASVPAPAIAPQFENAHQQRETAQLGIWIFLATEVLFFGAVFGAYAITRVAYPGAFAIASRLTNLPLATLNTAVLLTSSLSMALGVHAAQAGSRRGTVAWLWLTIALGVLFLAIKGVEYHIDFEENLVPGAGFGYTGPQSDQVQLFFFLYYVITGVHGVHVIIGIVAIAVIAWMAKQGRFGPEYFTPVDVTGLYWHLVDIIWIFVYPMLYLVWRS